ncbi:hypothetical protein HaLaN_22808, partial [Haematococcus lacustris]
MAEAAHVRWPFAGIATGTPAVFLYSLMRKGIAHSRRYNSRRSSWIRAQWRTVVEQWFAGFAFIAVRTFGDSCGVDQPASGASNELARHNMEQN